MPPPLGGALSDAFVWRLSVAYIGPNSRTERPRKTKIVTEVAHVTRDSDTTFKVKRSKVKVTRPLWSPPCWRVRRLQRWAWERVGRGKLLLRCRLLRRPQEEERDGAYREGRPPTVCLPRTGHVRTAGIRVGPIRQRRLKVYLYLILDFLWACLASFDWKTRLEPSTDGLTTWWARNFPIHMSCWTTGSTLAQNLPDWKLAHLYFHVIY